MLWLLPVCSSASFIMESDACQRRTQMSTAACTDVNFIKQVHKWCSMFSCRSGQAEVVDYCIFYWVGWGGSARITDREGGAIKKCDSRFMLTKHTLDVKFMLKLISANVFELYWWPFTGFALTHPGGSSM